MDDGGGTLIILLIIWGGAAVIPAAIAQNKGRSFGPWWFYGFLFWPVALAHALIMRPTQEVEELDALKSGRLKCPHCAEWIKAEAKVCRFCGRDVDPVAPESAVAEGSPG